jgi:hypothetical protein
MNIPFRTIPLNDGLVTFVDAQDYAELSRDEWAARCPNGIWYAYRRSDGEPMHRVIMHAPPGLDVDHRDGNGLNNRRRNLRECTRRQNCQNQRPQARPKVSRYKGVCVDKGNRPGKQWRAYIYAGPERSETDRRRHQIRLGNYATEEDAARAYDRGALRYFGDFAWLNFPDSLERAA